MAEEVTEPMQNPSFFKVLLDENVTKLKLPPAFVRKNISWNLPEAISLRLSDLGISWIVEMERNETGCYLTSGWAEFAKDLRLEACDFLIFRSGREKEFKVAVYGVNGCEKDIGAYFSSGIKNGNGKPNHGHNEKVKLEGQETSGINSSGNPVNSSFQKLLSIYGTRVLLVPKGISREFELGTRNRSLTIKDLKGKLFCVTAKVRRSSRNGQVDLTTGWSSLVRENGLEAGDTIEIEFLRKQGSVIGVLRLLSKKRSR